MGMTFFLAFAFFRYNPTLSTDRLTSTLRVESRMARCLSNHAGSHGRRIHETTSHRQCSIQRKLCRNERCPECPCIPLVGRGFLTRCHPEYGRALFYYFGMGRRPRPRLNNGDDISARPGISQKTSKKKA
jgi:hypothetical protein